MRILVTGAAGRLGHRVVEALVDAGHEVRATDVEPRRPLPVELVPAQLLERDACDRLCEGVETVVHLANHPSPFWNPPHVVFGENATMNMNLFQAAAERGVRRLVFASSIQTITWVQPRCAGEVTIPYLPLDSDVPARPGNAYALSKVVGEDMCRFFVERHGLEAVAIRFPYIALEEPRTLRDPFKAGKLNGNEAGTFIYNADAAELVAALCAADLPGYRLYLPASDANLFRRPPAEVAAAFYPEVPLRRPLDGMASLCDTSRIQRETGWRPRDRME